MSYFPNRLGFDASLDDGEAPASWSLGGEVEFLLAIPRNRDAVSGNGETPHQRPGIRRCAALNYSVDRLKRSKCERRDS